MRHLGMARRAGVLAAVTAAVVFSAAAPAAADVTVNPATAVQGSGENLYFSVPNGCASAVKEVTLRIPADTPIAEVYPLSVNDWAPKIEWRQLSTPIQPIHGSSPITQVPSAVTWLSVGPPLAPGKSAELPVAAGPLPSLSSMKFTVETTCSDGTKAPEQTATLALSPGTGAPAGGHHNGTTTSGGELTPEEQAALGQIIEMQNESDGPGTAAVAGWVVAALALLGAGWVILRDRRRRQQDEPAEPAADAGDSTTSTDDEKEPVAAGAGGKDDSKWSFKG